MWLKQCLCASLFPGSVFARRTTCLGGLALLMDIYGDKKVQGNNHVGVRFNLTFLASCHLLIIFANSLDPDQV